MSATVFPISMADLFGSPHQMHLHTDPENPAMAACCDLK